MKILLNETNQRGILIEYDAGWINPSDSRNQRIIREAIKSDTADDLVLYAILQKYNTPNRNGRIYPEQILKREAEKYQKLIDKGSSISELNHPESSLIDLDRVSHMITEIWWDGKMLMGKMKIITSPGWKKSGIISCKGDQAANLLQNGVTLGISSRGVGSLKREGGQNVVQEDFELVCFDLVSSPSTPGAYLIHSLDDRDKFDENIDMARDDKRVVHELSKANNLINKLDKFLKK
jgi:hypothetical protein